MTEKLTRMEHVLDLERLIDRYWSAAYAEGKDRRNVDTPDGLAQRIRTQINRKLKLLAKER